MNAMQVSNVLRCLSSVVFLVMCITSMLAEAASYQKTDGTIVDPIQQQCNLLEHFCNPIHPYTGPDLHRGAYLFNAGLQNAILPRADLSGADLRYANLKEVNLAKADLYYANLGNARLNDASRFFKKFALMLTPNARGRHWRNQEDFL